MRATAASMRIAISALGLAGALLLAGCGGDEQAGNTVEIDVTDSSESIDLEAYAEQRLEAGAVTLIDAALPDGTLMPAAHSGPTLGEIREAEKERQRAAAANRQEQQDDDEGNEPVLTSTPSPPAPEAEPVLRVDPAVTE